MKNERADWGGERTPDGRYRSNVIGRLIGHMRHNWRNEWHEEREHTLPLDSITGMLGPDPRNEIEKRLDIRLDSERLISEAKLTPRQEQVIRKHYIGERTQGEIAEELGVCPQAVSHCVKEAMKKLKRARRKGEKEGWL